MREKKYSEKEVVNSSQFSIDKNFVNKFKKFGGDHVPNIIEYLKDYIKKEPTVTISIGCDSINARRKTLYAVTIMLYNTDIRNGAHVVFYRDAQPKIRDTHSRLWNEANYMYELGNYLEENLQSFYTRQDLSLLELKKYKYHIQKSNGEYGNLTGHHEIKLVENLALSDVEKNFKFKLVDVHLDFNPFEGENFRNHSNKVYHEVTPWLRGCGFRVFCKHISFASTSAADLLLH